MSDWKKIICPCCDACNGPGAPACHACGTSLRAMGFAARRDEDDDDDEPRRPIKKKPRPLDDDDDDEPRRPAKRPAARRYEDDDDDDEPRRPVKKRRREEDEEEESLSDNTLLSMFLPVGVSIWAMSSFLFGILGVLAIGGGYALGGATGSKPLAMTVSGLGTALCILALPLGGLSFIRRPKKATYGGITGYLRAIIGLLLGFAGMVGGPIMLYFLYNLPLR